MLGAPKMGKLVFDLVKETQIFLDFLFILAFNTLKAPAQALKDVCKQKLHCPF